MRDGLPRGFGWLIAAQFMSGIADNALLIVAIAHLQFLGQPAWVAPLLKFSFTLSYVVLAPFIGALADAVCKRRLMAWMNGLKLLGAVAMLYGAPPLLAFALVGLGASAYAPAKYGLVTESVAAQRLVAANGWLESAVVLAVLLGTVLGGALISNAWLEAWWVQALAQLAPIAAGASLPALNVSLTLIVLAYAVSALCNWGIVPSGIRHAPRLWPPALLWAEFWRCNLILWRDRAGGFSLGITTLFWGTGAMLQFAVLQWGVSTLQLPLAKAAYLQGLVAVGVIGGAAWVARRLRLRHTSTVLPAGVLMGLLMAAAVWSPTWVWAAPALLLVGILGGMLLIPMNALLQHRGHRLLTAGQSIAVQGFNENACVLLTLLAYSGLLAVDVPVQLIVVLAGLGLAAYMAKIPWLRHRAGARSS